LSYRQKPRKPWLAVRKQGKKPVRVVAGMHFRLKKHAQKEEKAKKKEKAIILALVTRNEPLSKIG